MTNKATTTWDEARNAETAYDAFTASMDMIREILSHAETPETKMALVGLHGWVSASRALSAAQDELDLAESGHKEAESGDG